MLGSQSPYDWRLALSSEDGSRQCVRGRFAGRYMKDRVVAFGVRRKEFDHVIIIESQSRCAEALKEMSIATDTLQRMLGSIVIRPSRCQITVVHRSFDPN